MGCDYGSKNDEEFRFEERVRKLRNNLEKCGFAVFKVGDLTAIHKVMGLHQFRPNLGDVLLLEKRLKEREDFLNLAKGK